VSKTFPTVGIIADGPTTGMFLSPARALGIELLCFESTDTALGNTQKCDVVSIIQQTTSPTIAKAIEAAGVPVRPSFSAITFSRDRFDSRIEQDFQICVMVARSPHGQATTWAPTEIFKTDDKWVMSISPAPQLSAALHEKAQKLALDFSAESGAVGVIAVEMSVKDEEAFIVNVDMHPQSSGNWTVDGAITNQFEQHLRAILDLPLGDPSMNATYVVTGNYYCGDKPNMYRPYLHLMARTPALKFHQYENNLQPGELMGHLTLAGEDLPKLIEEIEHALEYMQGDIDE
jgi:phosphoribosylaminoimidazole carboxylase (NCAIR synthetase)